MSDLSGFPSLPSDLPPASAARQMALMERILERKLFQLDQEYQQTLAAEGNPSQSNASGPSSSQQTSSIYRDENGGEFVAVEATEEEWSEAWAKFKQEQDDDEEEAESSEDEVADTNVSGSVVVGSRLSTPLTDTQLTAIRRVMAGIQLRPPIWALGMKEEEWKSRILLRAGLGSAMASGDQAAAEAKPNNADKKKKKRKNKKKQKKSTNESSSIVDPKFNEFTPEFPSDTVATAAVSSPDTQQ